MSIASEITRLQTAKADIKTAIEAKGVTVPANAKLDNYDTYVASIPTSGTSILPQVIERTITTITSTDLAGITKIGKSAFFQCTNLTSVSLPSTVTVLEDDCFESTAITSIDLTNVTAIGGGAFENCTNLASITWPLSMTHTDLKTNTFTNTRFTSLNIPGYIKTIGWYCFRWNPALTSITFNEGLEETQWSSFEGCTGLTTITFPNGFKKFGHSTFYNCTGITSVSLPSSVELIDTEACYGCSSLTTINIPTNASLVKLGNKSFMNCTSLATITIPDNITNIDAQVFDGCTSLATINYTGTTTQWGSMTLGNNWHRNCPATVVHCSDGDVTL